MDKATLENAPYKDKIEHNEVHRTEIVQNIIKKWEDEGKKGQKPHNSEQHFSSLCYNAMVHPLMPFQAKGIIWYQGKTNAWQPKVYIDWFGEYVKMMQHKLDNEKLPVYYVQLAGFEKNVGGDGWANFRLAQAECLKFPYTGMVTAMDVGERDDIHPRNKQEVSRRLALLALERDYKKIKFGESPSIESIKEDDDTLTLTFKNVGKGLKIKEGEKVIGFTAYLSNGNKVDVEATITKKNTIVIKNNNYVTIKYAFKNYPDCNVYNSSNLPLFPFSKDLKQTL